MGGSDKHNAWWYALASVKLINSGSITAATRRIILALAFRASASSSNLIQSMTVESASMSHMYFSTQSRKFFSAVPRSMGSNLCGWTPFFFDALHVGPLQQSNCLIQL